MQLKLNCIRDLLLCLEDKLELNGVYHLNEMNLETICDCEIMKSYNQKDIVYSLFKLIEAGYIVGNVPCEDERSTVYTAMVKDITWQGHEFLNNIRAGTDTQPVPLEAENPVIISKAAISVLKNEISRSKSKVRQSEFTKKEERNNGSVLFQKKEKEDLNKAIRLLKSNICFSKTFPFISFAGKWCKDEDGWYYENVDGSNLNDEWFSDRGNNLKYHFDTFGNMDTGMTYIDNKWFYFDETDGHLITNYYNQSEGVISTSDGVVVRPEMPGLTLGVVSCYSENKTVIFFRITNMGNAPVTIGSSCKITDSKIDKEFYLFEDSEFAEGVTVDPKEEKTFSFAALDAHPLNIISGVTRVKYDITSEGIKYWISMSICDIEEIKDCASINHIDP